MNTISNPRVSIILPVYNASKYIETTIGNILGQTFSDFELLIINDGSTDDSRDIISKYVDSRIQLIDQENGGVSAARNSAIMNAKGEFIAFIDADDLWHRDKLKIQVEALDNAPNIDFCYTDRGLFDDDGPQPEIHCETGNIPVFEESLFLPLLKHNHIHCSSVVLRRKLLSKVGVFDSLLAASEDLDLWVRAAKLNNFLRVNLCLSFYRRHESNTIGSTSFRRNRVHAELQFLVRWFFYKDARKLIADNAMGNSHSLGYEEESIGNYKEAAGYLLMAFILGKRSLRLLLKIIYLYFFRRS